MKKFLIIFAAVFVSLFVAQGVVKAEETGPVIVQAIVQEGHRNVEITALLVKADTEEVVRTYKLNPDNYWVQKDTVPVGKYRIRVYADGITARSMTKIKATYMVREVIANPEVTEYLDKTPRFGIMEGDEKFLSDFYGMVDFARADGSTIKGEISREQMETYHKEAVFSQRDVLVPQHEEDRHFDEHDDVAGPGQEHGLSKKEIEDVKSEYQKEHTIEKYNPDKFEAKEENKGSKKKIILISLIAVIGLGAGSFAIYKKLNQ